MADTATATPPAASSGAPASTPAATTPSQAPVMQVQVSPEERSSHVMSLTRRYGSAERALEHVAGKQIHYQKRAQEAERQLDELRKRVPEGSVILTGDEAKAISSLKAKGIALDKVPTMLDDAAKLASEARVTTRKAAITKAAGEQYKQNVLSLLLGDKTNADGTYTVGHELEFKQHMERDGDELKPVDVPYIKINNTLEPLDKWLEREYKDTMDLVLATESKDSGAQTGGTSSNSGTVMPTQTRSSSATTNKSTAPKNAEVVTQALGNRYQTPAQRREAAAKK